MRAVPYMPYKKYFSFLGSQILYIEFSDIKNQGKQKPKIFREMFQIGYSCIDFESLMCYNGGVKKIQKEVYDMEVKTTMGEKLKDLRVERGLTTKQLCEMTQISESVYNGLENDSPRDTGYSRIITLAKFFDVPTDYLLGFTESRITKNIELKELGMSDKAIGVLMQHKQDNMLLSELIEHGEFSDLINAIDIYVRRVAAPNLAMMNDMLNMTQSGFETMFNGEEKPEGFDSAMKYIDETQVNEDEFLRFRISERFNRILRNIYDNHTSTVNQKFVDRMAESKMLSSCMLKAIEKIKSGELVVNDFEDALDAVFREAGVECPELTEAEMEEWYEKEHIIEDIFLKLPRSDLEIMSTGTDGLVESVAEMKKMMALANANSFRPPVQHQGQKRKKKKTH